MFADIAGAGDFSPFKTDFLARPKPNQIPIRNVVATSTIPMSKSPTKITKTTHGQTPAFGFSFSVSGLT